MRIITGIKPLQRMEKSDMTLCFLSTRKEDILYERLLWILHMVCIKTIVQCIVVKHVSVSLPDYIDDLVQETFQLCTQQQHTQESTCDVPEPLCSGYDRPDKTTAIARHTSRFSQQ